MTDIANFIVEEFKAGVPIDTIAKRCNKTKNSILITLALNGQYVSPYRVRKKSMCKGELIKKFNMDTSLGLPDLRNVSIHTIKRLYFYILGKQVDS
jgi:hypothetical protein